MSTESCGRWGCDCPDPISESTPTTETLTEAEQRGAVKGYDRGVGDAFLYATTEQYRWYGQPDEGLPNPYRASTSRDTESEPDDPPATRDMDPMWGRDTEGEDL